MLLAPTGALIVIMVYYITVEATATFFRFSLSPLLQLMFQVSLKVAFKLNNTITDGGVAPQCTFARPTLTHREQIDTR